jgi:RNA polymerase sigma-70 factor (ECF subfamily)
MEANIPLLDAVRLMDREALALTFERYAPALYNYALRCTRDPLAADHIVGDVYAKLLDKLRCGSGPRTNLRSYLFEIAYHLIVDQVRYNSHRAPIQVVDHLLHDEHNAEGLSEKHILFERIMRAIRHDLNEVQRHIIILRFLEGLSLRETADILGKSVNVVKVTQNRAIRMLRQSLVQHVVE